ncbi:oxidoreductase [Niastella yeongjuensis]|uniref:Oxidoreductase n=1 Tax=Niastella yeongjuensis TaxID=354355 RepID=A0A1V9EA61_9BACT|nr:SDR family oxidoreductase [Niastella yeongjuensis]OQP43000.1 oxidoreductase [Niastella yeongjuensis]SEO62733.1 NADP-dependent 3-hydroxy acid dehydrogenase YdfG [Niastella yeongjuensis]
MLQEKVIVITGASSGIGRATAKKLVSLGAHVVAAARRKTELDALAAESGGHMLAVPTDVTKRREVQLLAEAAIKKFGRIDVWINNAGVMPNSFFDEGKVDEWDRMVDVNIKGVLYGIDAALPHVLQSNGHILSIASVQALKTYPGTGVYTGTKFAVRAIMDSLREELAGKIRVTVINPGVVATDFTREITSEKLKTLFGDAANFPSLDPDAIANAIVYAVGQPAESAVTEITIRPSAQAH